MAGNPQPSLALRAIYALQSVALRMLFIAVRCLSLDRASALGGWLGRTFGPMLPRTRIARYNLERAFPEKAPAEIETIIRGMWDNIGRFAFEYPHLDQIRVIDGGDRITVVGAEHVDAAREDGKAGIFFSGHFANWELLGLCAAARGVPLNLVYRAPNNPYLAWLFDLRRSGDAEMLPKGPEGAKRALALLRRGAHLGMLVDQKMNDGIPVPFFGRDAMTAPALAQLALRHRCPVLAARTERLGGARFRITVLPPLTFPNTGDRHADETAAMRQVNALLESWIRDRPEQWLWLHRRWPDPSTPRNRTKG